MLRRFGAAVWVALTIARLRLMHAVVGIEAVNADLAARTLFAGDVLRAFGAKVGTATVVHGPLLIHNATSDYRALTIGHRCHVGRGVFFDLADEIVIGEDAIVSMQTTLLTHVNAGDRPAAEWVAARRAPVTIGRSAFLGARSLVMPGVQVGDRAVVGAGAVVTRDVPAAGIVAGIPARPMPSTSEGR